MHFLFLLVEDFHGFPVGFDEADAGTTHSLLLDYVLAEVGELLLYEDMVSSGNPTPNDLWATNRSLILTYQVDSVSSSHPFLWPYLIHVGQSLIIIKSNLNLNAICYIL